VPPAFTIPANSSDWPEKYKNIKLGKVVRSIRRGISYKDMKEELTSIGFNYAPELDIFEFDSVKLALIEYKKLNGDLLTPIKFMVPDESELWPEETWEMDLGNIVHRIRGGQMYEDKREELVEIGFDFDYRKQVYDFDLVKRALIRYRQENINLLVPRKFTVPPSWNEVRVRVMVRVRVRASVRIRATYST
jgi:hypothetical protein